MTIAKPTDWKTNPLPEQHATVPLDRTFSSQEMARIRKGLIPFQMEDKWFIYWRDDTLYFHRSWTGNCLYVVHFAAAGEAYKMVKAEVNRDPSQYRATDDEVDAARISFLIDLLLLHQPSVFPSDESSPEKQALMSWSFVGRAMFNQHPDDE